MGLQSKPTNTTTTNVYKNTTTTNPYAYSRTDNNGTTAGFQDGTALQSIYNFVNRSADSLLNDYMNPNLNSVTNQAKLNSFANTLASQSRANLENNIINPLSRRNMIRSSQATDMYRNLQNQNINEIANYANNLIATSQNDTARMLTNLLNYYMLGANYLTDMQNHSLNASSNGATKAQSKTTINGGAGETMQDILPAVISAMAAFV